MILKYINVNAQKKFIRLNTCYIYRTILFRHIHVLNIFNSCHFIESELRMHLVNCQI